MADLAVVLGGLLDLFCSLKGGPEVLARNLSLAGESQAVHQKLPVS